MKKTLAVVFAFLGVLAFGAENVIWDNQPGRGWENSWYPLGNGRLGCMVDGGARNLKLQFNVDSLWTGDKNLTKDIHDNRADANYSTMGAYQNFGELNIAIEGLGEGAVTDYRRQLNVSTAVYDDQFKIADDNFKRRIFASAPDDAIFIFISDVKKRRIRLTLKGAHGEGEKSDNNSVSFSGTLPNGLKYAARADVLKNFKSRGLTVVVLRAVTGTDTIGELSPTIYPSEVLQRHVADYKKYYDRMTLDLGEGDKAIPTRERLAKVKKGGKDVPLVALMFNFGRYLLISCSRPGTLPANLQGIWNNSNNPPWHADYHTNINIQMNYWGADSANLSDCFTPLSDWMLMSMPTAAEGSRMAFPDSKGYAYRTSANAFGGGGWRWNFAGAPWMAAQCYDHYLFTRDKKYLKEVCWPLMKGAAEFILSTQLKERPDGTIVVKDGWSPEHGPREDGVAHDQQIMRELFRSILAAAKELGINDAFVKEVARVEPKLLKDKIGKWGQLQEWEADRDVKGDQHRHTSHLYAVYPGSTISRKATPELAEAAKVALAGRTTTGDSRRSWTWPWRAALWARLGEGDKAGEMLESLLRYNTLDNMFATHPPFQIDGNLGMVAAVCEILLEKSIPADWKGGSVKGLRTREGKTVDFSW
ncbi:MAG: glycoside hydrolase N-terminal domain-containing protein [Kiritimatiellae bacterium]|nr:glycoside hydrolase N-terminal domain-containing protein [Kiritimatiellia bacterium]MBR3778047.1 glycoside hydrolase N-terminal domain-containing protein [Kiritimatiellia bacterium]